ncbi:hypothetical protein CN993_00820 [Bacillus thuringiensis]|uniref:hypothetical protein n=1 Tax=Bacillus thuringiensis TaxID=1428 RepID=UPI000BFE0875|nr:hypothetical protein [Bacillus thuringiensis]PGP49044.1 hypothetical protein CN993_00820 [Bacillus thuringiensis]HDR7687585.1 hypothetical protein [Bacillus toyonensis]
MEITFIFNNEKVSFDDVAKRLIEKGHGKLWYRLYEEGIFESAREIIANTENSYVICKDYVVVLNREGYILINSSDLTTIFATMKKQEANLLNQPIRNTAMVLSEETKEMLMQYRNEKNNTERAEGINVNPSNRNRADMGM